MENKKILSEEQLLGIKLRYPSVYVGLKNKTYSLETIQVLYWAMESIEEIEFPTEVIDILNMSDYYNTEDKYLQNDLSFIDTYSLVDKDTELIYTLIGFEDFLNQKPPEAEEKSDPARLYHATISHKKLRTIVFYLLKHGRDLDYIKQFVSKINTIFANYYIKVLLPQAPEVRHEYYQSEHHYYSLVLKRMMLETTLGHHGEDLFNLDYTVDAMRREIQSYEDVFLN